MYKNYILWKKSSIKTKVLGDIKYEWNEKIAWKTNTNVFTQIQWWKTIVQVYSTNGKWHSAYGLTSIHVEILYSSQNYSLPANFYSGLSVDFITCTRIYFMYTFVHDFKCIFVVKFDLFFLFFDVLRITIVHNGRLPNGRVCRFSVNRVFSVNSQRLSKRDRKYDNVFTRTTSGKSRAVHVVRNVEYYLDE